MIPFIPSENKQVVTAEQEDADYLSLLTDCVRLPDTSEVDSEWHRQLQLRLPMQLLYDRWLIQRVDQPYHEPDPGFVRKLKAISPDLSIHWVGKYQRWGLFIKHRVYYSVPYNGGIFRVQDTFPMMTELIQGPQGEYIPADERSLPELNFNNLDIHYYITMMNNRYAEFVVRHEKKKDEDFWDWQKEYGRQLEGILCERFHIEKPYQQKAYKKQSEIGGINGRSQSNAGN